MTLDTQNVGDLGDLTDVIYQDGLGISDQILQLPDLLEIQSTDAAGDCFVLEPITDPTTSEFIDLGSRFPVGTRFRITGSFDMLNNFAPAIAPGIPPEWTVVSNTFNPGTGTNTVCVAEDITDQTIPYGSIVREPVIVGANPERVADASIIDDLAFVWGGVQDYPIVLTDQPGSYIEVSGDVTGSVLKWDEVNILGSDGNDGQYEVTSATYMGGSNRTRIVLHGPEIPNAPTTGLDGTLRLENVDVTDWFQYILKNADSTTEEFIVNGNATGDVASGMQFRVFNNGVNDGLYTSSGVAVYDAVSNCTTIPVTGDITTDLIGGVLQSYRDNGITIFLSDEIGVEKVVEQAQSTAQLSGGGSFVGAWDYPAWDVGAFDEDLGQLINLYDNTL